MGAGSYCAAASLAKQVAALPSADERITAVWSAQNAFRPKLLPLGAALS